MTTTSVARSERLLEKIGARIGLTDCGRDWLIGAIDPFHDTPLRIEGYPDVNEASSVVQTVKLSTNIVVPVGIVGNWDCHIVQFPWLHNSRVWPGSWSSPSFPGGGTFNLGGSPATGAYGGLMYHAVASTSPQTNTFLTTDATGAHVNPLEPRLAPYLVGEYRVIGMGFEVINTTSDLNIQGLVTCYRAPFTDTDSAKSALVLSQSSGPPVTTVFGYLDTVSTSQVPINPGGALLLEGSKQWKAKEGCYVVSSLNSSEIPTGNTACSIVQKLDPADPSFVTNVTDYAISAPANASPITIPPTTPTNVIGLFGAFPSQTTKFNFAGAYFEGLSNSTTLTLNTVYIIERFPSQLDTDLIVLATPSARCDPQATDLYSEIIRSMPVGVPQRMNGMGDWFADAISTASDFIAPVLSSIPLPMAQMVSKAVSGAGSLAKKFAPAKPMQQSGPGSTYNAAGNQSVTKVKTVQQKKDKKKKK